MIIIVIFSQISTYRLFFFYSLGKSKCFRPGGNVWELCWDWYVAYTDGAKTDPRGAVSGAHRVRRGGCLDEEAVLARSAFRFYVYPDVRSEVLGFRLARP